jgi:hypothetical protein
VEVGVGHRGSDLPPGGDQVVDPLVRGQHPQEHDDPPALEAEVVAQIVDRQVWLEHLGVHAVRQNDHSTIAPPALGQLPREGNRRREKTDRPPEARPLDDSRDYRQEAATRDRPVIDQLSREAALEIRHRRPTEQAAQDGGQHRSLVQVAMDHIGPEVAGGPRGRHHEQQVEAGLVGRESDR